MILMQGGRTDSGRIVRLKERLMSQRLEISIERARLFTHVYRETEGETEILRRAKAIAKVIREMEIRIWPDELIVGNRTALPRMGVLSPEMAVEWIDEELDIFPTRPQDKFWVSEGDKRELREAIFPYWRGRTLNDWIQAHMPPATQQASRARVFKVNQTDKGQGHILPDYSRVVRQGFLAIRDEIEARLEAINLRLRGNLGSRWPESRSPDRKDDRKDDCEDDREDEVATSAVRLGTGSYQDVQLEPELDDYNSRRLFYEAALIVLDAAIELGPRYAELARKMAQDESDRGRRLELMEIADICERVPAQPAQTFREALQALWLAHVALQCESNASSISLGRLDQWLYPYYDSDLRSGALTRMEVLELLSCLWIKCNEIIMVRSTESAKHFAGFPVNPTVTIGGQTCGGLDASNDLSLLCLEATAGVGLPQPNIAVRLHTKTPDLFLMKACEVIRLGMGLPHAYNDEVVIPALLNRGVALPDARDYAIVGCVEVSIPGKTYGLHDIALFNMVKALELAMSGGRCRLTGEEVGMKTGDPYEFKSFADLEKAYMVQVEYFASHAIEASNVVDLAHAALAPTPLLSCLVDGCLERGMDVTAGGARYNFSGIQGIGLANVADSLQAVKQLIFEEGKVSLREVLDALDRNFEGYDGLRETLLNCAPKFGNDDDNVDLLAARWASIFASCIERGRNPRGGRFQPGFYTVSAHVPLGEEVGATPDGRLAREPLADGGLSPVRGRDRKGPTAVLKSLGKIDQVRASNGTLLNQKFLPSVLEGPEGLAKFAAFLRAFVALKVMQIQFNVVSAATLRDAQRNPDQYRGLVVRVAGYSAFFVDLNKVLQDDIIKRTEQTL
ncbi:MAG: glycyl radical protein [Firmicutes bacterium]|nr:glycyl radical protein [Bacillota bacterium]